LTSLAQVKAPMSTHSMPALPRVPLQTARLIEMRVDHGARRAVRCDLRRGAYRPRKGAGSMTARRAIESTKISCIL